MAHFSGDAGLARIFSAPDAADPFAALAAGWLGVPVAKVRRCAGSGPAGGCAERSASACSASVALPRRRGMPAGAAGAHPGRARAPCRAAARPRLPQVSQQQRDHAKQLTYGLLYGMGPSRLADELGCSVAEARDAQVRRRAGVHDALHSSASVRRTMAPLHQRSSSHSA